jgi:hypothetical protein
MANDLYGELLARALQRRAPPGHFPAFITEGEGWLLRSQGGGVAPGGGQYMAGGLPAFFSSADDPGGGPAEADIGMETAIGADLDDAIANAQTQNDPVSAVVSTEDPSGAVGSPSVSGDDPSGGLGNIGAVGFGTGGGVFGGMAGAFAAERHYADAAKGTTGPNANTSAQQTTNQNSLVDMVNQGLITDKTAIDIAKGDISDGGLGSQSPGGFAANYSDEDLSMAQIAAINAIDPATGDYAGTLTAPELGTTAFDLAIKASEANALAFPEFANLIGFAPAVLPGGAFLSAAAALSGRSPALLSSFSPAAAQSAASVGRTAGQTISNALAGVGSFLDRGAEALGITPDGSSPSVGGGGGGFEGGVPDIEIVPPIATDTDVAPALTARTYAEVDAKEKERALANILAGLTRTGRPTEGVTAFGPVFT